MGPPVDPPNSAGGTPEDSDGSNSSQLRSSTPTKECFEYVRRYNDVTIRDDATTKMRPMTDAEYGLWFTTPGVILWKLPHWKEMMPFTTDYNVRSLTTKEIFEPRVSDATKEGGPNYYDVWKDARLYGPVYFKGKSDPVRFYVCVYYLYATVANARPGDGWFAQVKQKGRKKLVPVYGGVTKGNWKQRCQATYENAITSLAFFYMEGNFGYPISGKNITMRSYLGHLGALPETIYGKAGAAGSGNIPDDELPVSDDDELPVSDDGEMTKAEMLDKCSRFGELMDFAQEHLLVVDADNTLTTWEFKRNTVIAKSIGSLRDEPRRKTSSGVFSNRGIYSGRNDDAAKDGRSGFSRTKGAYFQTFRVWDSVSWWLTDDKVKKSDYYLAPDEVLQMGEEYRRAHQLETQESGMKLSAARKTDRMTSNPVPKKARTDAADNFVETERTDVETYQFHEGYLTAGMMEYLQEFRDRKPDVVISTAFKNKVKRLGPSDEVYEKAVRDEFFSLAMVALQENELLGSALDMEGDPCENVQIWLTHLFDQQKPPAAGSGGNSA